MAEMNFVLIGTDGERRELTPEDVALMKKDGQFDRIEFAPSTVSVIAGDRGGMATRGLRLEAQGVIIDVILPEAPARDIGKQLGDAGIERASVLPPSPG